MLLAGTDAFLEQLLCKRFEDWNEHVITLHGSKVTERYFMENGFDEPILIPDKEGLRLKVPESSFSIPDVAQIVGLDHVVEVIDVRSQEDTRMSMREFSEFFYMPERNRLLNVLSMEFSKTPMRDLVDPPQVVLELSLVEKCWPPVDEDEDDELRITKPSVQKYCLMSMADSYTDFHIDFGGSSVWYHILWGEKIFYLIPPNRENLRAYRKWYSLPDNRTKFFPNFLAAYKGESVGTTPVYQLRVRAGNTILLPSGWLHAVYTPVDSIVFGGNFLHSLSIPLQFAIYRMEKKLKTDTKFLFPYFEKLHWFVGEVILGICKNYHSLKTKPPAHYLEGGRCLAKTLDKWLRRRKSMEKSSRTYFLPERHTMEISCVDLVRQLREVVSRLSDSKPSSSVMSYNREKGKRKKNRDSKSYSAKEEGESHSKKKKSKKSHVTVKSKSSSNHSVSDSKYLVAENTSLRNSPQTEQSCGNDSSSLNCNLPSTSRYFTCSKQASSNSGLERHSTSNSLDWTRGSNITHLKDYK